MTETLEETPVDSSAYADVMKLIDATMRDISGTSITSSSAIVDALLDIRSYVDKIAESVNN